MQKNENASESSKQQLEVSEEIRKRASEVIENGDAYKFLIDAWRKRHYNDIFLGKALIISMASGCATNTKGIHIFASGPKGCGKTDAVKKAQLLIDDLHLLDGDISPQAIFYLGDNIFPGTVIAIDDLVWSSNLGATVKRCTSKFQEGAKHSIVKEFNPETYQAQKRLAFWVTSVDNQADEQLRDRFLMIEVKSSPEHIEKVLEFMKAKDKGADAGDNPDDEIIICKLITEDLHNQRFEVIIPFADKIQFTGEQRGYGIFGDMIKSLAVLRYKKREVDDKGRLLAAEEDFWDAKEVFDGLGGHSANKYTESELKVLNAIVANSYQATIKEIQEKTQLSDGRIGDILNGRGKGDQQKHGLLYKCPDLSKEDGRPIIYRLSKRFDLTNQGVSMVTLAQASD